MHYNYHYIPSKVYIAKLLLASSIISYFTQLLLAQSHDEAENLYYLNFFPGSFSIVLCMQISLFYTSNMAEVMKPFNYLLTLDSLFIK